MLTGAWITDRGTAQLASTECTPDKVHIYPLRWNSTPDGSGAGGTIRELRKHPDDVHISFNALSISGATIAQYGYFARLQFNQRPPQEHPLPLGMISSMSLGYTLLVARLLFPLMATS